MQLLATEMHADDSRVRIARSIFREMLISSVTSEHTQENSLMFATFAREDSRSHQICDVIFEMCIGLSFSLLSDVLLFISEANDHSVAIFVANDSVSKRTWIDISE